jgi:hypothetical protein
MKTLLPEEMFALVKLIMRYASLASQLRLLNSSVVIILHWLLRVRATVIKLEPLKIFVLHSARAYDGYGVFH